MRNLKIGGHRGLGATDSEHARQQRDSGTLIPENTLEAFTGAFEAGADFIEFDVVPAKDGLVVTHSARLAEHVFSVHAPATYTAELTVAALQRLPVGHRGAAADRMPTLAETLRAVQPFLNGERFLNIEVKGLGGTGHIFSPEAQRGFTSLILQTVHAAGLPGLFDRVLFSSFQPSMLHLLHQQHPGLRLGQLFTAAPETGYLEFTADTIAITLAGLPGVALHPPLQSYMDGAAPAVPVDTAVNIWVNREEPVAQLLPHWQSAIRQSGPTRQLGLITDYPQELRAALDL